MLKEALSQMKTASALLLTLTMLTGIIYPLLVLLISNVFFPWHAAGAMIERKEQFVGSTFIGQVFTSPGYFFGRPSATPFRPYNGAFSAGSNLGPSNPLFLSTVAARVQALKALDPDNIALIPVDLVTASGSGLDPDISPLAAFYQVSRVAKARNISKEKVEALIQAHVQKRPWGILGEPRINVLLLNLALDDMT